MQIPQEQKEFLTQNKNYFSSFLKSFLLKQVKTTFLEGEIPTLIV